MRQKVKIYLKKSKGLKVNINLKCMHYLKLMLNVGGWKSVKTINQVKLRTSSLTKYWHWNTDLFPWSEVGKKT